MASDPILFTLQFYQRSAFITHDKLKNHMNKILMNSAVILFFVSTVLGCATTENYERQLTDIIGNPESFLIRSWGPPDNIYNGEVSKFITYNRQGSIYIPGSTPMIQTTIIGNTAFTNAIGGSPAMNIEVRCKTTFEIKNGYVINWRWEGNGCKSN